MSYTLNGGEPVDVAFGETIPVFKGADVVLTVIPEPNFMVENWQIDGITEQTNVKKWTFNDISDDINVEVVFGAQTYPAGNAFRAEVAAVLMRFVELVL